MSKTKKCFFVVFLCVIFCCWKLSAQRVKVFCVIFAFVAILSDFFHVHVPESELERSPAGRDRRRATINYRVGSIERLVTAPRLIFNSICSDITSPCRRFKWKWFRFMLLTFGRGRASFMLVSHVHSSWPFRCRWLFYFSSNQLFPWTSCSWGSSFSGCLLFCLRLKHVSGSYRSDKSGVRKGSVNTFNSSQLNSLLSFAWYIAVNYLKSSSLRLLLGWSSRRRRLLSADWKRSWLLARRRSHIRFSCLFLLVYLESNLKEKSLREVNVSFTAGKENDFRLRERKLISIGKLSESNW